MTGLAYTIAIATLFIALLAWETEDGAARLKRSSAGLLGWLAADNWPAKVGGGLVVLGVGALLRYLLLHVAVPPDFKLASGALMAGMLALLAWRFEGQPARRGLHLALAGAAAGVAYLTAYSAFALFGYVDDLAGATLLVLVSAAVSVFALRVEAASMAVLGMLGAYAAPAFGLGDPGPAVVFGYYFVLSALVLAMVLLRGWRPLIHLSFLFTLAGGLFFGWSAHYYRPEYYAVMQPALLALVALHLAMPIIERRRSIFGAAEPGAWLAHLDRGYFIALPAVAVALTYAIAPRISPEAALGSFALAVLWSVAAAVVYANRAEAARHGVVAALLAVAAALAWFDDLPGTLLGLFMMAALLTLAVRLELSEALEGFASFMVTLLASLYVLQSMFERGHGTVLLNPWFGERLLAAALMAWCAWLRRARAPGFAQFLNVIAVVLLFESVVVELLRIHLEITAELLNLLACAALAAAAWRVRHWSAAPSLARAALLLLWLSAAWGAGTDAGTRPMLVATLAVLDLAALAWAARGFAGMSVSDDTTAIAALWVVPLIVAHWCSALFPLSGDSAGFLLMTTVTLALLATTIYGATLPWTDERWSRAVLPAVFWCAAYLLGAIATCYIARGAWPVAYELASLVLLSTIAWLLREARGGAGRTLACMLAAAAVLQAGMLRLFTPAMPGHEVMSLLDLADMRLPAVVSLTWALLGAALAWWGGRSGQRGAWSAGSALMVLAAAKLVLFDFGSLGELGNIVALIAAGGVFLLVAWAVPMPPRATPTTPAADAEVPRPKGHVPKAEFGTFNLKPREDEAPPPVG